MGWTLVLFTWEIYKGKDRFSIEWGQLVFVDKTATKWFLLSTWDYLGGESSPASSSISQLD